MGSRSGGSGPSGSNLGNREASVLTRRLDATGLSSTRSPRQSEQDSAAAERTARADAVALLQRQLQSTQAALDAALKRDIAAEARVAELEGELAEVTRSANFQAIRDEVVRLELDVRTLREAKRNSEIIALDARAARKEVEARLEEVQISAPFQLGSILMDGFKTRWGFLRLPARLREWRRVTARSGSEDVFGSASAIQSHAIERAVAHADQFGIESAEKWVQDQRYPAPLLARVLLELGKHVRKTQPVASVRLAKHAAESDPNEMRIKHLAFILMDAGSIGEASEVLRSAVAAGAPLNATEERRSEELAALARMQAQPLKLPTRKPAVPPGDTRRLLVYAAQSLPFHWSAVSMRACAVAQAAVLAGWSAEIATPPGYPPKREEGKFDVAESIEGIVHHRLNGVDVEPAVVDVYAHRAGLALSRLARLKGASAIFVSSEVHTAYPAVIASRLTGLPLIFDHNRATFNGTSDQDRLFGRMQAELLKEADVVFARSASLADQLGQLQLDTGATVLISDAAPTFKLDRKATDWRNDPVLAGRTILGYVGDPHEDLDLEFLPNLVRDLVGDQLDVALVVFGVGTRFQNLKDKAIGLGVGDRVLIAGRPRVGAIASAYGAIDIIVAPEKPSAASATLRARYEIDEALGYGRAVVTTGSRAPSGSGEPYLQQGVDQVEVTALVADLVRDPERRKTLEGRAANHARAHASLESMATAFAGIDAASQRSRI